MGPREPLDRSPGGSKDKVSTHRSHSLHASFRTLASVDRSEMWGSVAMQYLGCKKGSAAIRMSEDKICPHCPRYVGGDAKGIPAGLHVRLFVGCYLTQRTVNKTPATERSRANQPIVSDTLPIALSTTNCIGGSISSSLSSCAR